MALIRLAHFTTAILILVFGKCKSDIPLRCSRVPSLWNGELSGSCQRLVGSECRFSCKEPYILRGSSQRTCGPDGKWTGEAPSCELGVFAEQCSSCEASPPFMKQAMAQCPSLIPPAGGTLDGTCSPGQVGSTCIFRCPGQSVNGQPVLVCLPSGAWSDNPPTCGGTTTGTGSGGVCRVLTPPSGGRLIGSCTGAATGDICQLVCISGFRPSDTRVLVCQQNGMWSDTLPTCIGGGAQCPPIVVPQGTTSGNCNTGSPGQACTVVCYPGYTLVGSGTVTCQQNGQWSGIIPTCSTVRCPSLPAPSNGANSGSCLAATVGHSCIFACRSGFRLIGQSALVCRSGGTWSSPPPTCAASTCPALFPPINGATSGSCTQATTGQSCSFSCFPGYSLSGQQILICGSNGQWSSTVPFCRQSSCPPLNPPANGYQTGSCQQASAGQSCTFTCLSGYQLIGMSTLTCQGGGTWSGNPPTCSENLRTCPILIAPLNGYLIGTCAPGQSGQSCIFGCNENYVLEGQRTLVCQTNGIWNANMPRCVRSGGGESCPPLNPPPNGEFVECDNRSGGRCVVNCLRGFIRSGSRVRTCLPQGTWSGFAPVCTRKAVYGYKVVPLWTFLFG